MLSEMLRWASRRASLIRNCLGQQAGPTVLKMSRIKGL